MSREARRNAVEAEVARLGVSVASEEGDTLAVWACEEILTLLVPFGIRAARLGKEETVGLLARATGGGVPGSGQAAPGETVRGGVADAISP